MSGNDIYEGSDPEFSRRVQALIAASGGRVSIISAHRSVERQQQLWNNAVRQYGSEAAARRWVAPPGRSNHNRGVAMDLRFANNDAREWVHENAARFGLTFPMDHEPWHIEPIGVRNGTYNKMEFDPEAYTIPPDGIPSPEEKPRRLSDHMFSLHEMLMNPSQFQGQEEPEGDIGTPVHLLPGGKAVGSLGFKGGKAVAGGAKSILGYDVEDVTGMEQADASAP